MGGEPISLWGNIDATSFKMDAGAKHQEKYVALPASAFLALQRRAEELEREVVEANATAEARFYAASAEVLRVRKERDEARAALHDIDAMLPPRMPPMHPASMPHRIRVVIDAALRAEGGRDA